MGLKVLDNFVKLLMKDSSTVDTLSPSKTGINGKSTGGGFILSHCMVTATHAETIEGSYN